MRPLLHIRSCGRQRRPAHESSDCGLGMRRARDRSVDRSGFGHEFNFTDAPNRYGLPPFYSLHAWVWKDNPAGTFEMCNPGVNCDAT